MWKQKALQFTSNIFESLLETVAQRYYDDVVTLRYSKPRVAKMVQSNVNTYVFSFCFISLSLWEDECHQHE